MSLSLIIPYHDASLYLELCLSSLRKDDDLITEIIVVSNGGTAPSSATSNGKVRVIHHNDAIGYAGAIKCGVEESKGSHLLFCDADTFFPRAGWIASHQRLREQRPEIGITSSKLINVRTDRILDFGIGRTRFNNFHPFRDAPRSDWRVQRSRRVQMACSAVMMIEKDLFHALGGFDPTLRHHYQDIDLSLRLKEIQREVWVVGDAIAYHRGHSSDIVRAPFQIDERAHFTVKNAALLEIDYPSYLREALEPYRALFDSRGPFGVVNLSTLLDVTEALEVVSEFTTLNELARWIPNRRDLDFIALLDVVDARVLRHSQPLLIIVDRFSSLRFNSLWRTARDTHRDMVIDRHANAYRFDEVADL